MARRRSLVQAQLRARHRRPLGRGPEMLELRAMLSIAPVYYSVDGTQNNLQHPDWGSAGADLLQIAPPAYSDGVSTPAGGDRPSARDISNVVGAQTGDIDNNRQLSPWVYAWGQFIDHDLDLTPAGTTDSLPISVPTGDPQFDPDGTGTQAIDFFRAVTDPATGTSAANPLQHPTQVTSYIDGSMIYGSDPTRAAALRTFEEGHLKTSAGGLLPYDTAGLPIANDTGLLPDSQLFLAGDVRANENIELTTITTLFVREHNYWADTLAAQHPTWNDEQLYQAARQRVIAEIQHITYDEFLPALLGPDAMTPYQGYDANVNPSISVEFSTAAYRFGHSMLDNDVSFMNNDGSESSAGLLFELATDNPSLLTDPSTGVDTILKYLSSDNTQEIDLKVVDQFRNLLFGAAGQGGQDLYAIDIQRGRDLGLPDYNTARVAFGLPAVNDFSQITSDPTVEAELKQLYGSVNNVDLFIGGLAEDHLPGDSLGPLFTRIIADQFERTRDGDRLWYQRTFSGGDLADVQNTTLADIVRRNTGVTNLQDNLFFFTPYSIAGQVYVDPNRDGTDQQVEPGLAGVVVDLLDSAGNSVAQTVTAADGTYSFGNLDQGAAYQVKVVSPSATGQFTTPGSLDVTLADGSGAGEFGVDFGYVAVPAVSSLPPLSPASFVVNWSTGMPDNSMLPLDILVSQDGGPMKPWLRSTTQISATFHGDLGHTYGFAAVVARPAQAPPPQNASAPPTAQATTRAVIKDTNGEYIVAVYQSLLNRLVDEGGLAWWTNLLDSGTPRSAVVDRLDHSTEYFGLVIDAAYQKLLDRSPDTAGLKYWTGAMQSGTSDEQLDAVLAGSDESYQHNGGDKPSWLAALYPSVLGRPIDATGDAFWTTQLAAGTSRAQIVAEVLAGAEREGQQVVADYQLFFARVPDPQGVDYWIGQLGKGQTDEGLITELVSSEEYFSKHTSDN
jgi:peroxidase